jgi:Mrp family chromosome partitioning ATPase
LSESDHPDNGGEARSEIDGARITGDVVQARDVSGGVHFHPVPEGAQGPRVIPHQLPADVSSFINRGPELRALARLAPVRDARGTAAMVVVISGSAGVGKTALAVHWAPGPGALR